MNNKYHDITLAFAGIFQAAALVDSIAKTGALDEAAYEATIQSLFKIDAKNIEDIYGDIHNLKLGLSKLIEILDKNNADPDTDISTYVISLVHLERKFMNDLNMEHELARHIKYSLSQAQSFSPTHPQVIVSLADTYLKTLGSYQLRIKVVGKPEYLNAPEIIHKIRAILLAGLRSAVLWQQVGGSRLQLLYAREKMVSVAREIAASLKQ